MRCGIIIIFIASSAIEVIQCADPLTSSDLWRIRSGWGARDDAERQRWAAAGYDANGKRISDNSENHSTTTQGYSSRGGRVTLPDQEYMSRMDPSSKRLRLFEQGMLPLTRSEAIALFSGEEPTAFSDATIREAFQAARFLLGQITADDLPSAYRTLLRRAALREAVASGELQRAFLAQALVERVGSQNVFGGWDERGQPIIGKKSGDSYLFGWDSRGQPIMALPNGSGFVIRQEDGSLTQLNPTGEGFGGFDNKGVWRSFKPLEN